MKIGVVGHVSRRDRFAALCADVDADCFNLDDGSLGCAGNHRRVWNHVGRLVGPADWGLVLEDDAVPCNNFRLQAQAALRRVPERIDVVSFYLGRERPAPWQDRIYTATSVARRDDLCWILSDAVIHGVALAIRGLFIPKMLMCTAPSKRPMDESMTQWCRRFGHDVAFTWPSLVDHADVPTVINHHDDHEERESGRVAWQFGDRAYWTNRAVRMV